LTERGHLLCAQHAMTYLGVRERVCCQKRSRHYLTFTAKGKGGARKLLRTQHRRDHAELKGQDIRPVGWEDRETKEGKGVKLESFPLKKAGRTGECSYYTEKKDARTNPPYGNQRKHGSKEGAFQQTKGRKTGPKGVPPRINQINGRKEGAQPGRRTRKTALEDSGPRKEGGFVQGEKRGREGNTSFKDQSKGRKTHNTKKKKKTTHQTTDRQRKERMLRGSR